MTYGSFLLIFLLPPALFLAFRLRRHVPRRALLLPVAVSAVAVLYTTPWDNYLVASRIWWYDPDRISGVLLGWVPLEEYLFFALQPLLTGWWTLWLIGHRYLDSRTIGWKAPRSEGAPLQDLGSTGGPPTRTPSPGGSDHPAPNPGSAWIRLAALLPVGGLWAGSLWALLSGMTDLRYLGLILVWALPPLALQLAYGAPALRKLGRVAFWSIAPATVYLATADGLAIAVGIWTINPKTSTGWLLFGVLPLEELAFFLLTNTLITLSVLLIGSAAFWSSSPAVPIGARSANL